MTVVTVTINDEKGEEALNALQAVAEAFNLNLKIDERKFAKEDDSILVSATEWADIQKRLDTEQFYEEFESSIKSIKDAIDGKIKLKNAKHLFDGH